MNNVSSNNISELLGGNFKATGALQSNPLLASVLEMCKEKNPKDVFYSECERRGVNPEDILKQLR